MIIREDIYHGSYHNRREVEVPDLSPESVISVLSESQYNANMAHRRASLGLDHIGKMSFELETKGRSNLGWADYRVVAR